MTKLFLLLIIAAAISIICATCAEAQTPQLVVYHSPAMPATQAAEAVEMCRKAWPVFTIKRIEAIGKPPLQLTTANFRRYWDWWYASRPRTSHFSIAVLPPLIDPQGRKNRAGLADCETAIVFVPRGSARRQLAANTVCHELGHLIGGYRHPGTTPAADQWRVVGTFMDPAADWSKVLPAPR